MKLVRVLIAATAALTAAVAVQLATSSGASATNLPGTLPIAPPAGRSAQTEMQPFAEP